MIVVLGSTGTGKSQLGVEIAEHLTSSPTDKYKSGGIISCDSMQVYKGLDVITNKATKGEMRDVRHELIDFLVVDKEYSMSDFLSDAKRLGEEMISQKQLPIAVGGTTYYVQHLLFPANVVRERSKAVQERKDAENAPSPLNPTQATEPQSDALREAMSSLSDELRETWQIVLSTAPTSTPPVDSSKLWALLQALDPLMASRWHPLDGRKIANSLRVIIDTGRQASEWTKIQEQRGDDEEADAASTMEVARWNGRPLKVLFLWVWADKPILDSRLDARVEKMIPRGLLDEIHALRSIVAESSDPESADHTRGIFQAIGYKEFKPFLDALDAHRSHADDTTFPQLPDLPSDLQRLFQQGLEDMKTATRQYAKRQVYWIQNQLMPEIRRRRAAGQDVQIAILDTGDVSRWEQNVKSPALDVVDSFLRGEDSCLPDAILQSDAYQRMLKPMLARHDDRSKKDDSKLQDNVHMLCPSCTKAALDRYERDCQKRLKLNGGDESQMPPRPTPVYYRAADEQKHKSGKVHRASLNYQSLLQRLERQGNLVEHGDEVQKKKEERAKRKAELARIEEEKRREAERETKQAL